MNVEEIVYNLKNDFTFLSEVIVYNNPVAVQDKIVESYPAEFENEQAMLDVIYQFAGVGNEEFVTNALSVPFDETNASEELLRAWNQIKSEAGKTAKFSDWSDGLFGAIGTIGGAWLDDTPETVVYADAPRRDFTMWYVVGGAVAVIILVLVLTLTRRN
jgi:hypothetical protein